MRIKRSDTIVVSLEGDGFVFHNYLEQQTFSASPTALEIVRRLRAWTDLEAVVDSLPGYSRASVVRSLEQMIALAAIVAEGSEEAARAEEFARRWLWGPWAAAYHFSTKRGNFMSGDAGEALLRQRMKWHPSPPLYETNPPSAGAAPTSIPDTFVEPFLTMSRRRTNRIMLDEAVGLDQILDCFLYSLAITAIMKDPEAVDLPLKMTPSGGARNPYEGYLCARNVEGLTPGTYHYSAFDRTLAPIAAARPPAFGRLLAGQDWADNAAAIIFLVADFERTMWKYHDGSAYRITMIEAGHIAQNIMLVATHHDLAANGTGALDQGLVEETLGLTRPTQSAVYALAIGRPDHARREAAAAAV